MVYGNLERQKKKTKKNGIDEGNVPFIDLLWGDKMSIQLIENKFQVVEELLSKMRTKLVSPLLIISIGKFAERSQVVELYGDNYQTIWNDFLSYYKRKNLEQAPYFRLDVVTEEKKITFQELQELIGSVNRNFQLMIKIIVAI